MNLPPTESRQRTVAIVAVSGLVLLWGGGVWEAVRFCFLPWKGYPNGPEDFPFIGIVLLSGFITLQVLLLFVVLRPRDLSNHARRLWAALLLLSYFFFLDYNSLRMGYDVQTDAPEGWLTMLGLISVVAIIIASLIFLPATLFPRLSRRNSKNAN